MNARFRKYELHGDYHWRELSLLHPKKFNAILHARYRAILDLLRLEPRGLGVDLGCGDGALTVRIARLGHDVVGLDAEPAGVAIGHRMAARRPTPGRITWLRGNATAIPLRRDSCSFVILGEIIEHLDSPVRLLAEASRIMKPGGLVIITTPQRLEGHSWDPENHRREYTGEELHEVIERHFENVTTRASLPMRLFRAYRLRSPWRTPVRITVNLASMAGYNPFRHGPSGSPNPRFGQLISWGRRSSASQESRKRPGS